MAYFLSGAHTELVIRVLSPSEEAEIRSEIAERAGESLGNTAADDATDPALPATIPFALIPDTLPSADDFRPWLEAKTYLKGIKWLKQVVAALGGKINHSKGDLITELMHITAGDPQKLQPLTKVPA